MDTSWWLALVAVVLLAFVAALVDGWGRRGRRRPPRSARPGSRGAAGERPRPAEIWWADVPPDDGAEGDLPCLVLAVRGDRAVVARITSRYREERTGVIPLPPGTVGDPRDHPRFLETDELRDVPLWDFRRRVGAVDPALWDQVRYLAG
ncbi:MULTISPECIES: type II toxin-antitoxin system PemK/MazF family toxin [unclassified Streptomyces]|uniref:type II toxin-antitoxin system PemK/MazF family toxin n=1 Tax=unclassified Streptomyces TaxID=2593676 RepID=UPI0004BE71DE|nr:MULTISPECIES: type II toxin-antitoxin system PemK/MazF family toxin [unclassified Streptomyces]